jgi:hypothetical protein
LFRENNSSACYELEEAMRATDQIVPEVEEWKRSLACLAEPACWQQQMGS